MVVVYCRMRDFIRHLRELRKAIKLTINCTIHEAQIELNKYMDSVLLPHPYLKTYLAFCMCFFRLFKPVSRATPTKVFKFKI
jgi:hypothetical protein